MEVAPSARPETPVTQMGSFAGMASGRGLQTWPEQVCSARSQFPTLATWSLGSHRILKKNRPSLLGDFVLCGLGLSISHLFDLYRVGSSSAWEGDPGG